MKPEQWHQVIGKAVEESAATLLDHEEGTFRAFTKGDGKLTIQLSVTITGKGLSADVDASIGYVVERVKEHGETRTIFFDQEPLPGMPEPTRGKKAKVGHA